MTKSSNVARERQEDSRSVFDKFAGHTAEFVSKAPFFTFCVLIVLVWAPSFLFVGNLQTYQLLINTPTTIITFLLVALLQNTQKRGEEVIQHKLNAVADGLADLMEHFASDESEPRPRKTSPETSRISGRQWGSKKRCRRATTTSVTLAPPP